MEPKGVIPPLTEYLYRKATARHIPLSGTFELTPRCNMDCRMCYVRMTQAEMDATGGRLRTPEEWLRLGEAAKEAGMLYLLVTGGEPFLYPGFRQVYEGLARMGLVLSINSNGTLLNEEWVDWLAARKPERINVTLYGGSNETYTRLCRNPKGFDQVTENIRRLRQAGITVKLNCSLTSWNAEDLEQIVAFAEEHRLILEVATYMFPPVRRDESKAGQNERFTPEEAAYYRCKTLLLQYGKERFLDFAKTLEEGTAPGIEPGCEWQEEGDGVLCRAGRAAFWVTWDGRMLPCGMMTGPVVQPFRDGFSTAWKRLVEETAKIRLSPQCANCRVKKACSTCAAMTYSETGRFDGTAEYRCRYMEALPEQAKRLQLELEQ